MAQSAVRTIDHEAIRTWVEARAGRPALVRSTVTGEGQSESGLLRIDFGEANEEFDEISWDEFFRIFDDRELAFLYQEEKDGEESRFCKFVERSDEDSAAPEADAADRDDL